MAAEAISTSTNRLVAAAERLVRPLENAAAVLAGIMMLAAMTLTTADALLRYSINRPISFNYFFTENYLLVGMICLAFSWGFRTGGYIRISFLLNLLPPNVGNLLIRIGYIASSIFCADLAILGGFNWYDAYSTGLVELDVVDWPWHWSWIWVPIGLGLLCLRLLLMAFGPADQLNTAHSAEDEMI